MALLAFVSNDSKENGRSSLTDLSLESISKTVDLRQNSRHRLICVDNGSCFETIETLKKWAKRLPRMSVIWNPVNSGQPYALNQAWTFFKEDDRCLARCDNDVYFKTPGWLDLLEECVERDSSIGICSLKHPDLLDKPEAEGWMKTAYETLPHDRGQRHIIVERIEHTLGACQLINANLFEKIGFLDCLGVWGWEDSLYALRCKLAGFKSVYAHVGHFEDLDKIKNATYQSWKDQTAQAWRLVHDEMAAEYKSGVRPLRCEFEWKV